MAGAVGGLTLPDLPPEVLERVQPMLVDLFGVTLAGMRTPELRRLVESWHCPPGDAPLIGDGRRSAPETTAMLSAIAACCLELDEGNKYAAGHPAAHVVFAAIAAVRLRDRQVSGAAFLSAVVAGYEVAARFGHATALDPGWHPHGHWGATGAACAATMLLGGTTTQVAAAVDAATGLMQVTPWATVLDGSFTRNLWIGGANRAGLDAARLAMSGLVQNTGAAWHSLGDLVGTLDPAVLVEGLGRDWLTAKGYAKQHSSCSYTHPAVDAVQTLKSARAWTPDEVTRVRVVTHSLARPLLNRDPQNRLAAMFSLAFVVSVAVVNDVVDPVVMEPGSATFLAAQEFSARVEVEIDEALDAYLPQLRCADVTVEFADGGSLALSQPNPIGDADHFPLTAEDIDRKLTALIGAEDVARIHAVVDSLAASDDACTALDELP